MAVFTVVLILLIIFLAGVVVGFVLLLSAIHRFKCRFGVVDKVPPNMRVPKKHITDMSKGSVARIWYFSVSHDKDGKPMSLPNADVYPYNSFKGNSVVYRDLGGKFHVIIPKGAKFDSRVTDSYIAIDSIKPVSRLFIRAYAYSMVWEMDKLAKVDEVMSR